MNLEWEKFYQEATSKLGCPYEFGAKWHLGDPEPEGPVDCSGYTRWVYSRIGVYIPEGSSAQYDASVPIKEVQLGDLGFFIKDGTVHHVGILLNATDVIEARGKPYNKVIIRPRSKWEAFSEFSGWRRPKAVCEVELS